MINSVFTRRKKVLTLTISILLGLNTLVAKAEDFGPIKGGDITLGNGDTVRYDEPSDTIPISGIDLSSPTDKLTITGSVTVDMNTAANAKGISLANGNSNNLGSGTTINVNSGNGSVSGLNIDKQSTVVADNITINSSVPSGIGHGISLSGGSTLDLGNGGSITASGDNLSMGVLVTGNSVFNANGLTITRKGGEGQGISVEGGSIANLGNGSLITVTGIKGGDGLRAMGAGAQVTANQLTIETNAGYGATIQSGASLDLGSGSSIKTSGTNNSGIWAVANGSTVQANNISVETSGSNAAAIYAQNGGQVDIGAGSHITTQLSHGLSAQSSGSIINFKGDVNNRNLITVHSQAAVQANGTGSTVNLENTDIIADNTNSSLVLGLWAVTNGTINAKNTSITTAEEGASVYAMTGGKANLTGKTIIEAGLNNQSALATQGANAAITLTGQAFIKGNIFASGTNSVIDLNTDSGSVYTGYSTVDAADPGASINLKMTGSTWNMTDNSQVNKLNLDNTTINFTNENYTTLKADSLEGNGLFNIHTDIISQQSDLIVINGIAQGTHKLNITNNGAASTDGTETLTVIQTGTNNANFTLNNKVELGAYEYGLRSSAANANNIELYSSGASTGGLTTTAQAAGSFLNIGYLTNYIESQTLLQRLGDLRNNQQGTVKQNGFWMKEFGGKLNSFSGTALDHFDMAYTGTQLGIDKQIDAQNGNLLIGAMAGYTRTNPNYREGNGDGKNYTAGLYATYLLDDGLYIDSVLKYNSMRNHFNVKDTAGNSVKGTGKTQGITLTAEIGKRYWLNSHNQGLYLEPQAQLTYGYQNGDTVHASNGLNVGLSHYNSTLGRVSGIIGYQIQGETPVNVYLKTGIVREMSGGASYRFNDGNKNNHSFRSSWFDNGLGINANINKKHNIYAEVDYATGNHFDNAKLDIGYRYSF